jgi:hypothetical protein
VKEQTRRWKFFPESPYFTGCNVSAGRKAAKRQIFKILGYAGLTDSLDMRITPAV